MVEFLRDVRFGLRLLRRSPVFTLVAASLLAIGISANTIIFSVIDALLLRPLPVSHAEQLVRLIEVHPHNFLTWEFPYGLCETAANNPDFSEVICEGEADLSLNVGTETERARVNFVSPNFFSSLGVSPYLGRVLGPQDDKVAAMNAVLSYDFWRRRFGRAPFIIGRTIHIHGRPFTVVGVLPKNFNGLTVDTAPDLRVSASLDRWVMDPYDGTKPGSRILFAQIFGRLRPGVDVQTASSRIERTLRQHYEDALHRVLISDEEMPRRSESQLRLESIANGVSALRTQFSSGLNVLMAGVALLLVMACANVGGLLVARSTNRVQEIAVRLAIGASRNRITRQLLTESLILGILGGTLGIVLTFAGLPLLLRALPPIRDRSAVMLPLTVHIGIDLRILAFALLITLLASILFGLSPAWLGSGADLAGTLRAVRSTPQRNLARKVMVVAQVAVCTIVLIGAALLVETLQRLRSADSGFDRDHVVTFTFDPVMRGYKPEQIRVLTDTLLHNVRSIPSVANAAIASRGVMRGTGVKATLQPIGTPITSQDFLNTSLNTVTPGYFQTLGMRILEGRDFNGSDARPTVPRPVIVNETLAHRFFHGRSALGQRIGNRGPNGIASGDDQIIGVVTDAKYRSLREEIPPTVYGVFVQDFNSSIVLNVRVDGQEPERIIGPVRAALQSLDPQLPVLEVQTLSEEVEASLWQERLLATLGSVFGIIAAMLASIGLYGALDYAVKARTREIGVRVALGAEPFRIIRLLSREMFVLIAVGVAIGLGGYAIATAWIRKMLYGVTAWNPAAILAAIAVIAGAALFASFSPIRRAVRIQPAKALRDE
jgi:predicted permease